MKRRVIVVAMIVLVALFANAAGNQESSSKEENTLRVKCVSWIAKKGLVSQAVEDFQKENPDIEVILELVDEVNAQTQSILWAAGKTDCDIFIGIDPSTTPNFVGQDYIYTMEELNCWATNALYALGLFFAFAGMYLYDLLPITTSVTFRR